VKRLLIGTVVCAASAAMASAQDHPPHRRPPLARPAQSWSWTTPRSRAWRSEWRHTEERHVMISRPAWCVRPRDTSRTPLRAARSTTSMRRPAMSNGYLAQRHQGEETSATGPIEFTLLSFSKPPSPHARRACRRRGPLAGRSAALKSVTTRSTPGAKLTRRSGLGCCTDYHGVSLRWTSPGQGQVFVKRARRPWPRAPRLKPAHGCAVPGRPYDRPEWAAHLWMNTPFYLDVGAPIIAARISGPRPHAAGLEVCQLRGQRQPTARAQRGRGLARTESLVRRYKGEIEASAAA